jgi:hypothetical protein
LTCVSLLFRHVFSVHIRNQCSDFELVPQTRFGHNAIWYIPPNQKVNTNSEARASFGKNATKREFTSALIYRLQRKESHESNVDNTSTNRQLLVIWKSDDRHEFIVCVMLVKHDNTITLDKDVLKKLDYSHIDLLRNSRTVESTWVLDDETALATTLKCEKRIRTTEITISKGTKGNGCMVPLRISSNM